MLSKHLKQEAFIKIYMSLYVCYPDQTQSFRGNQLLKLKLDYSLIIPVVFISTSFFTRHLHFMCLAFTLTSFENSKAQSLNVEHKM